MKRLLAKISLLLIGLAPSLAFAATNNIDKLGEDLGITTFTPDLSDKSVGYLGELFGTVGGVLHGTSGQIMSRLFEALNYGILVVAGFFLIYTILNAIINTAQDGQFMGQKFNSAWVVVRTVTGLSLLVPKFSGYSMIQVIVMWVVVQGVGLANIAWDKALTYLEEGNAVHTKPIKVPPELVGNMGQIMMAQTCAFKSGLDRNITRSPKLIYNAEDRTITFPYGCGVITYGQDGTDSFAKRSKSNIPKTASNASNASTNNDSSQMSINSHTENAIQQAMSTMRPAAKQVAQAMYADENLSMYNGTNVSSSLVNKVTTALVAASADYINLIKPAQTVIKDRTQDKVKGYFNQARDDGWIMAGRYYYALGQIKSSGRQSLANYLPKVSIAAEPDSVAKDAVAEIEPMVANIKQVVNKSLGIQKRNTVSLTEGANAWGPVKSIMASVDGTLNDAVNPENLDSEDPIFNIQQTGVGLMRASIAIWVVGGVASAAAGVAGVWASISPGAYIASNAVNWLAPFAFGISTMLFTTGVMMGIYVPLIPFIIFSFAALGWIIAVIEAVVAGPLVALGVTHPEGHDWLGKGEQAIMLLLSVFIRPILMIIGLIAAMVLSRVFLGFLTEGFNAVYVDAVYEGSGAGLGGIYDIAKIFIFASLSITVVTVVYSGCIVELTRKVMIWIGLHDQQDTAVSQALGAAKEGAGDYARGASAMGSGQSSKNVSGDTKRAFSRGDPGATLG